MALVVTGLNLYGFIEEDEPARYWNVVGVALGGITIIWSVDIIREEKKKK